MSVDYINAAITTLAAISAINLGILYLLYKENKKRGL